MDKSGIKVRIFDIENGLREYKDIKIIRIISKDYNLLIMKDYLPIIGEIEGSVDIKNDEVNLSFKDIKAFYGKIVDKRCILTINNLKPGSYSFKYFHDKNNNNKIDTNFIGIPKEGFGFANNAMNKFGPPDFKKTVFEVKQDTTLVCKACYMKF